MHITHREFNFTELKSTLEYSLLFSSDQARFPPSETEYVLQEVGSQHLTDKKKTYYLH